MFIPKNCNTILFILSINFLLSCSNNSSDYSSIFGDDYLEAGNFFHNNKWIVDSIARYGVDPYQAISIVFPEVIRYSAIKDIFETHSLEVLYAQYGSKYADFSIGRFQIKPSFAYRIEQDWNSYIKDNPNPIIETFDTLNTASNRIQRVQRLKDLKWQIRYLIIFCKLTDSLIDKKKFDPEQILSLKAVAYNLGCWHDINAIQSKKRLNYFHIGLLMHKECFNYSDIALYYYHKTKMPK